MWYIALTIAIAIIFCGISYFWCRPCLKGKEKKERKEDKNVDENCVIQNRRSNINFALNISHRNNYLKNRKPISCSCQIPFYLTSENDKPGKLIETNSKDALVEPLDYTHSCAHQVQVQSATTLEIVFRNRSEKVQSSAQSAITSTPYLK